MATRQRQAGPDFNDARLWTERQVRAGKLDITQLQIELNGLGFLKSGTEERPGWEPGKFDRATFNALVEFQRKYTQAVKELGRHAEKDWKALTIDGKCGDKTIMALGYYEAAAGMLERKLDMEEKPRVLEAKPTRNVKPPVTRAPEQLTEEAAMARIQRIVESGWARCTIQASQIGTWDYSERGQEPTYEYQIKFIMPDKRIVELTLHGNRFFAIGELNRTEGRAALKAMLIAALENYGESGQLRLARETGVPGKYALITNVSMIEVGESYKERQLYSYQTGASEDLKRTRYDDGATYLVHVARALKPYDKS